jgi:hypothetical protein
MTTQQLAELLLALLLGLGPDVRQPFAPVIDALRPLAAPSVVTVTINAGDNLQAALDAAPAGAIVTIPPGATFAGNYVIRKSLTLRTAGPLPDRRMNRTDVLGILRTSTTTPALRCEQGTTGISIVGIRLESRTTIGNGIGSALECGTATETIRERQPADILIDRVVVQGNPAGGTRRGLSLHVARLTLTRSYIYDVVMDGFETQAVWMMNGPCAPCTIVDNYLEASGENFMIGGDDPRIVDLVPSDVLFEGNTVTRPPAWRAQPWDVKNLFEIKNGRRITVRKNLFEHHWAGAQPGAAILITPRNQYGRAPWTVVEDVVFEHNIVRNVGSGFNLLGDDNEQPSQRTQRVTFRHNLILVDRVTWGGDGRCLMVGRAPQLVTWDHNTCLSNGSSAVYSYRGGTSLTSADARWTNSIFQHNAYGFFGDGAAPGTSSLTAFYPGATWASNVVSGAPNVYPAGTLRPTTTQFSTFVGPDGRLLPGHPYSNAATDGTDLGVDYAALPEGR